MARRTQAVTVFRAEDRLSRTLSRIERNNSRTTRRMGMNWRNVNRHIRATSASLNSMLSNIGRINPLMGMLGAGAIIHGGSDLVKTAAEYESVATTIAFASGSAEEGARNLQFLRKTSVDMAIDFRSAADGFKRFSANFIGTGVAAEEQREMFTGVSKAIRVMGLDADQTTSVFRALGEIVSKGKLMSQELKLQLANAMPGTTQNMAWALGFKDKGKVKAVTQLYKAMEAGAIDGLKAVRAFTKYAGENFESGMVDAVQTASAKLTQLSIQWYFLKVDLGRAIIDSGILDHLTKVVKLMNNWIMANKQLISQKLKNAMNWIVDIGKYIMQNGDTIWEWVKVLAKAFIALKIAATGASIAVALTSGPIGWITAALALLSVAIFDAATQSESLRKSFVEMEKDPSWWEGFVLSLNNIGQAFGSVEKHGTDAFTRLKKLSIGISMLLMELYMIIGYVVDALGNLFGYDLGEVEKIKKEIEKLDRMANPEIYKNIENKPLIDTAAAERQIAQPEYTMDRDSVLNKLALALKDTANNDVNVNLYAAEGVDAVLAPESKGFNFNVQRLAE